MSICNNNNSHHNTKAQRMMPIYKFLKPPFCIILFGWKIDRY